MSLITKLYLRAKRGLMAAYYLTVIAFLKIKLRFQKSGAEKPIWFVCERGYDARDNGYVFYTYLKEHHPEIRTVYGIREDAPDAVRIAKEDIIPFGTIKHLETIIKAQALISTHDYGYTPDMVVFHHLWKARLFNGIKVFLQHGIIKENIAWYHAPECYPDIFVTAAEQEAKFIREAMGQGNNVRTTGLCRYDRLRDNRKNMLLIVPTWREYITEDENVRFEETEYYKNWEEFIFNPRLHSYLAETGMEAVFYPHIEMQKYLPYFKGNKYVRITDAKTDDLATLLMDCQVLVTDYSSVFFDVVYMKKPVIFFQFDTEEYYGRHYPKGYLKNENFGIVCATVDDTVDAVEHPLCIDQDSFFKYNDRNNCERVYNEIRKELEKRAEKDRKRNRR